MLRTRKKSISLLVALAFVLTLVLPVGAALGATGTITALSVPVYDDDPANQPQTLGRVRVVVPAGSILNEDVVNVSITPGFRFDGDADGNADDLFCTTVQGDTVAAGVYNYVQVPSSYGTTSNGLQASDLSVTKIGRYEFQIEATADQALDADFVFYIYFNAICVDEGTTADCVVTLDGPSGTGFPTGSVVIGTSGVEAGDVSLAAMATKTDNDTFTFTLRIKESKAGSLSTKTPSLALTLPDGYEWDTATPSETLLWGDTFADLTFSADEETLKINVSKKTSKASAWDIPLKFYVSDESQVEAGAIIAKVSGKSSIATKELKVGTYGEFAVSIDVDGDAPTLIAGRDEQEIADIVITESLAGSLVTGRTITLTLPEGVAWQKVYEALLAGDDPNDSSYALDDFTSKKNLDIDFVGYVGAEYRTAKFKVTQASSDADAVVRLRDVQVALAPGFSGDLTVTVGGTASLSGELVVATVVPPVKVSASATPEVVIGRTGQAAGDLTIAETDAGVLLDDEEVQVVLPAGVEFDGTPKVDVAGGDVEIRSVRVKEGDDNNEYLEFVIDRESTEPSTIVISDIKLNLYHIPPQGAVTVGVGGAAVAETGSYGDEVDEWPALGRVAIAKAVPLESQPSQVTRVTAVLTVGSTTMTVNGEAVNMDVAPYIDTATNRTYVPVRYVAQALGVTADNIYFSNGVVTLLKDSRAVQMTIGSKTLVVNGVAVSMDAAPVIVSGRTMLPFRWVATALGASVSWDEAAKSVTVEL